MNKKKKKKLFGHRKYSCMQSIPTSKISYLKIPVPIFKTNKSESTICHL